VLAAGGIVLRREQPPLIAIVRLRKRDEWVLPKGKLDDGETARVAARREVLEETGHNVTVYEFLGTLVYESGGRSKVVHYWSMEADGERSRALMSDVRAVDWLPLGAALERLSRGHERTFLEYVGPLAVNGFSRRSKTRSGAVKKRRRSILTPGPAAVEPSAGARPPDLPPSAMVMEESPIVAADEAVFDTKVEPEIAAAVEPTRWSLAQRLRSWLGRADDH
jgi:8-oxo-dGTP diphosphatase